MKFRSIAQFNLFKAVASGTRKVIGLSRNQAKKDTKSKTTKGLPARAKAPATKRVKVRSKK